MKNKKENTASSKKERTEEGDYYFTEAGLMVFTANYLNKRGYCCKNGCRHCPYGFTK
ncbi:MAG: DUF5522 domain-containing protein [Cytophagaceae bacterium]